MGKVDSRDVALTRLRRLEIEDVGLIRRADVEFDEALTVFTGETGSGKTMLLNALALATGERASADMVRRGAERARVTLEIDLDDRARAAFADAGYPLDDDEGALVVRELSAAGKASVRINGRTAPASTLRALLGGLVERVSQHDQQRLLDPQAHLEFVDRFGGTVLLAARSEVERVHDELSAVEERISMLRAEAEGADRARADAAEELARIDALEPVLGEDVVLRQRRDRLAHAERIAAAVNATRAALVDDDGSVSASAGAAYRALQAVSELDPQFGALIERLVALQSEAADISASVEAIVGEYDVDATASEAAAERLERIERLKRRHGGTLEQVLAARAKFQEILDGGASSARDIARLESERDALATEQATVAARLSDLRAESGRRLQAAVRAELAALEMRNARFEVVFTARERIERTGAERGEFVFAANAGEPLRPLQRAASGGELSRLLLATIVVLAEHASIATLIFDEIDTGVGGATALAIGERLKRLAAKAQVLCVTHLAQIAAAGTRQYVLEKRVEDDRTEIGLRSAATRGERERELARMLSGNASEISRRHAAELLDA